MKMAVDTDLMLETLVLDYGRLQKGQIVVYEREKAEVIGVDPLLVIKTEERL
jgi:hypothetical protein